MVLKHRTHQSRLECLFLTLMILVSVALTVLQFRWTGEVADAEAARLKDALEEQAVRFTNEAARELSNACRVLRRTGVDGDKPAEAWAEKLKKAHDAGMKPFFKRVVLVRYIAGKPVLSAVNMTTGALEPMEWPAEWEPVRQSPDRLPGGLGGPPLDGNRNGLRLQFPFMKEPSGDVFGAEWNPRRDPVEWLVRMDVSGWVIAELDADYLRDRWIPELAKRYLDLPGGVRQDVAVRSGEDPSARVLYTTIHPAKGLKPTLSLPFELTTWPGGDRNVRRHGGPELSTWVLDVYRQPGTLEKVVATTRRKNLLAAFLLDGLILAAGVLLLQQTRRSRHLAEMQMHFVAGVSHELRTPLTVIRGAAHNLRRGIIRDPERVAHYAGLVEDYSMQLTGIVEQVLEFARAGQVQALMVLKPMELPSVIRQAVAMTEEETTTAACTVEVQAPAVMPTLHGDADALRHAFQNLIVNAAKHGGSGGWIGITVSVVARGEARIAEVRVMDRGPGIPEGERADVFNPFVRGERARSAQVRGSGLGLSLVKTIVEAHRGTVWVEGEPGGGAVFVVVLPIGDVS
jgi:signal transduction histidine kinase